MFIILVEIVGALESSRAFGRMSLNGLLVPQAVLKQEIKRTKEGT